MIYHFSSKDLHKSAERAVKDYRFNVNLTLPQVNYINMNEHEKLLNLTEYSPHFKQEVYPGSSGVQIPIELYEGCKYA